MEEPTEDELAQASKKRGGKTGQYEAKYTVETILDVMREVENNGRKVKELQTLCYDEVGMSRAAFYRIWPEFKKSPFIKLRGGRWYLI